LTFDAGCRRGDALPPPGGSTNPSNIRLHRMVPFDDGKRLRCRTRRVPDVTIAAKRQRTFTTT